MASETRSSEIARAVRHLLARPAAPVNSPAPVIRPVARSAMVGGLALLTLGPAAVNAAGLGEARTTSALGEPLRATVPMKLGQGETLRPGCVTTPVRAGGDLRSPAGTRVRSPAKTGPGIVDLEVTSRKPLYEPLYELTLQVDCPGLPKIMRHYVLMLDLPGLALPAGPGVAVNTRREETPTVAARRETVAPRPRRTTALAATREPIPSGKRYRVREGDTLSTIAARVEGRAPNTTWQLAEQIFAANPQAFIRNNPDLIKLGYEITIPDPAIVADGFTVENRVPLPTTAPAALPAPGGTPVTIEPAVASPALETDIPAPPEAVPPVLTTEPQQAATRIADAAEDFTLPPASAGSPFADEVAPAPRQSTAEFNEPQPVVLTPRESVRVNPLLAVLLGLLLGLGLSILLLRSKLLEGLSNLFARNRLEPSAKPADPIYADTDEWLKTEEGLHAEALAVGSPAEQTYIVEVAEAEETAADADAPVAEQTSDFDIPFAPPDEAVDPDLGKPMEAGADPDAADNGEIADTAEVPHAETGPADDAMGLSDPANTGETAAMPEAGFDSSIEPEMAELFADDLSELPAEPDLPVEVFAGMESDTESNPMAPTEEMPAFEDTAELYDDDATIGSPAGGLEDLITDVNAADTSDLQGLADDESLDESRLSETLQEALSLLERDFSDELTASQIVDQKSLKRMMEEHDAAEDLDETELRQQPKKRAG